VRHTDACRLAQSGAGEDDRASPRQLVEAARNLIGRQSDGIRKLDRVVLVPTHVDEHGAFL